jgi:hypothetical protein
MAPRFALFWGLNRLALHREAKFSEPCPPSLRCGRHEGVAVQARFLRRLFAAKAAMGAAATPE